MKRHARQFCENSRIGVIELQIQEWVYVCLPATTLLAANARPTMQANCIALVDELFNLHIIQFLLCDSCIFSGTCERRCCYAQRWEVEHGMQLACSVINIFIVLEECLAWAEQLANPAGSSLHFYGQHYSPLVFYTYELWYRCYRDSSLHFWESSVIAIMWIASVLK